jgi:hypothetical protein
MVITRVSDDVRRLFGNRFEENIGDVTINFYRSHHDCEYYIVVEKLGHYIYRNLDTNWGELAADVECYFGNRQ